MTPILTPRQWEVLRVMATGVTYAGAAHELGCARNTVRQHLWQTYERLDVSGLTGAFLAVGWLRPLPYGSVAP